MEEKMKLTDLISIENLQALQNAFVDMCGISVSIRDENDNLLTQPSMELDFCLEYNMKSLIGKHKCEICDKKVTHMALEDKKQVIHKCYAGLYGFATPIVVNGEFMGSITGGKVRIDELDENVLVKLAQELNLDPVSYVEAAKKIPCIDRKELEKIAKFMNQMANTISSMAYDKYQLYQIKEEVEHAAKMKSDFLANMSHEIRTPMNAVIGMAEMALREQLPETAKEYIGQIISSGKTLLTIINDVLDFSKIDAGKMLIEEEEYELLSIVNDISNIINTRIADKDIELILDINPQMPSVLMGDVNRLKQIIINLSNNAVKFTKEGQVVLKVDFNKKSEDEMDLLVSVQDTGIGIKKADLLKLFEAFHQLDSKRNRNIEGTGLGLAICKSLLNLMKGRIWVESEYGKGSTFSFSLPQKIVDGEPCVKVEDTEKIKAAGLVANGFLKKHMEKDMLQMGIEYISLKSAKELSILTDKDINYLFIGQGMYSKEVKQFVKNHPDIKAILMIDFRSELKSEQENLVVVKKPVYVTNLALLFNGEDITSGFMHTNVEDFDFIAPTAEILIVDDNVINLTVAEGLLKPLRMKIDKATGGEQAIEMITAKRYDLVFMDHMMPEVDGVEATRVIRRFHPELSDLPIIALTANAVNGTKEMFLDEGMNDFVAKPIEIRNFVSKIRTWLPKNKIEKVTNSMESTVALQEEKIIIEGLDTEAAMNLVGSSKLFMTILKEFYQLIEKKTLIIKEAEINEDWERYTIEVHALKSTSRQIGATELGEMAAKLEKAGNDKDGKLIHECTDDMLQLYCSYIDVLRPYFESRAKDGIVFKQMTTKVLLGFFNDIRLAIEELEMDRVEEIVEKMSGYQYDGEDKENFKKLREKAQEYDAEGCEKVLQCWENIIE